MKRNSSNGKFWSGTSGLVIPVPNKSSFPPAFRDKSRLTYYASLFNSIEINSSFYKVPMGATVSKWVASVPDNFQFTFKLWKEITHARGLAFDPEQVLTFLKVIDNAGAKKGCLLLQFPPSFTLDQFSRLEQLIETIQHANHHHSWNVALEFRHHSWYISEVYELADQHQCSVVLHDMPAKGNRRLNTHADFVYLRFHGPTGDYRGGYTEAVLTEYAADITSWLSEGRNVYTYFNNTIGDAIKDLATLNLLVDNIRT